MKKLERLEQLRDFPASGTEVERAEWSFPSTLGNNAIHVTFWSKTRHPRAILQLAHGMCEHMGRYEEFARAAAEHGILVVGNDHLGHGHSVSSPEYFGYFGMEDGQENLVRDMYALTREMKRLYPNLPYVLFGHSFGSMLAQLYVTRYTEGADLLLLCGTASPNPLAKLLRRKVNRHIHRYGLFSREEKFRKLQNFLFNLPIRHRTGPNDWLSTLPDEIEKFVRDPLCDFTFTSGGYRDLLTTNILIGEKRWFQQVPKQLPVRIFAGQLDPVGSYGKGPENMAKQLKKAGVRDVTCKLYPQVRHELLHDTSRDEAITDFIGAILAFLGENTPTL